jgi:hypothetical protein
LIADSINQILCKFAFDSINIRKTQRVSQYIEKETSCINEKEKKKKIKKDYFVKKVYAKCDNAVGKIY